MQLSDFNYYLPENLIAQRPLKKRSDSRLLCLNKTNGEVVHRHFGEIVELLAANDLLVLNNSRVIPARLLGQKESGGRVEVLVDRILDNNRILCLLRASKKPKPQSLLLFANNIYFQVLCRHDDLFELKCMDERPVLEVIEEIGEVPLPHYMGRLPDSTDKERYQTVYAHSKGSVAAPTAGLHFDEEILTKLQGKKVEIGYVTLHVGTGTFSAVRVKDITQHRMHTEFFSVPSSLHQQIIQTKARGGRVIAVGTTTARSLETASRNPEALSGYTNIFIYPGFKFHWVDALITNFHLPGSTLLMLVAAWGGLEPVLNAYKIAVQQQYRFFSYGDAMWIG